MYRALLLVIMVLAVLFEFNDLAHAVSADCSRAMMPSGRTRCATQQISTNGQSLRLSGTNRWVVLASRQNVDEAIGIARFYAASAVEAAPLRALIKVIKSDNGWYAVVLGPEHTATIQEFRDRLKAVGSEIAIPEDAYLSQGAPYQEIVWQSKSSILAESSLGDGTFAQIRDGSLFLSISAKPDGKNGWNIDVTGQIGNTIAFSTEAENGLMLPPEATAKILVLDKTSRYPQVVVSTYSGGAHCCTDTLIATAVNDNWQWSVVTADSTDGDSGFEFEDLAGDGVSELIGRDEAFLYAFDSHAESYTPAKILKLDRKILRNATRDAWALPYLRQDLFRMEYEAQRYDAWHTNGFLAGWVAAKALVGQFDDAWSRMLALYDRNDNWDSHQLEGCTNSTPIEQCPESMKRRLSFPEGLKRFLVARGYIGADAVATVPCVTSWNHYDPGHPICDVQGNVPAQPAVTGRLATTLKGSHAQNNPTNHLKQGAPIAAAPNGTSYWLRTILKRTLQLIGAALIISFLLTFIRANRARMRMGAAGADQQRQTNPGSTGDRTGQQQHSNTDGQRAKAYRSHNDPEMKKLYRDIIRKYHPDYARSDEDKKFRTDLTARINEAYEQGDIDTLRLFQLS